ncbi:hypothetical protein L2D14_06880 [Thalassospiraceae bacterium LMO-JJ14]|nr:hypothetical protein L2D14_06880 [Thalassospiraceae bacterium LMO-JJ14]
MSMPGDLHDDLEEDETIDSNHYGVLTGIAGILIGAGLIVFMFMLADGFS